MGNSRMYNVNPKITAFTIDGHQNENGMSWIIGAVFLIGQLAGGGMVVMPYTMLNTGLWPGIFCILFGAIISGYTGIQLGHNWTLMQNRWSEYKEHCRNPYPEMAYRALGTKMKRFVEVLLFATQFGVSVVFLLLVSKNISNFLSVFFGLSIDFCAMILIVAIFLLPFIMLKSPKEFWYIAVGAVLSTTLAVVLLLIGAAKDAETCVPEAHYSEVRVQGLFLAYGSIMFAYGGHASFPTIQHDMKKPFYFHRSVITAFTVTAGLYLPVSFIGYLVYGNSLQDSIIPSIQTVWIQQSVNIMITVHVLLTIVILFSPLSQGIEHMVKAPHEFGIRRVAVRTTILLCVVFVAESLPHFGVILDLVGASASTLMGLVLPSIFYLYLNASAKRNEDTKRKTGKEEKENEYATIQDIFRYTSKRTLLATGFVLVFALLCGIASTYSAIQQLFHSELSPPCYVRFFLTKSAYETFASTATITCCGQFKNISVPGVEGQCFM